MQPGPPHSLPSHCPCLAHSWFQGAPRGPGHHTGPSSGETPLGLSLTSSLHTTARKATLALPKPPWTLSGSSPHLQPSPHPGLAPGPTLAPSGPSSFPLPGTPSLGLCFWAHALATCNSLLNINHPNPLSSKTAALPHLTAPASPDTPPPHRAHRLSVRERAANCAAGMRPRCSANMEQTAPSCVPSPGLYHCLLPV